MKLTPFSRTALDILEKGNLKGIVQEDLQDSCRQLEGMMFMATSDVERKYYKKVKKRICEELAERSKVESK